MVFERGGRVLNAGAGGFIGPHLTEVLSRDGAAVCAPACGSCWGIIGAFDETPANELAECDAVASIVADPCLMRSAVAGCGTAYHRAAPLGIPCSVAALARRDVTLMQETRAVVAASEHESGRRLRHASTPEISGTAPCTQIDERILLVCPSLPSARVCG